MTARTSATAQTEGRDNSDQAGSSLLETLVALAIVAALGSASIFLALGGIKSAATALSAVRASAAALEADEALRRAASAIRLPVWERAFSPTWNGSEMSLPYSRGERDCRIIIAEGGGSLTVETGEERSIFADVHVIAAGPLIVEGRLLGILVKYRSGDRVYRCAARFGGAALGASLGAEVPGGAIRPGDAELSAAPTAVLYEARSAVLCAAPPGSQATPSAARP